MRQPARWIGFPVRDDFDVNIRSLPAPPAQYQRALVVIGRPWPPFAPQELYAELVASPLFDID